MEQLFNGHAHHDKRDIEYQRIDKLTRIGFSNSLFQFSNLAWLSRLILLLVLLVLQVPLAKLVLLGNLRRSKIDDH